MWQLILRNPLRQKWRSALTLGGIAVGVALLVWSNAFVGAWMQALVRGATAVELGQVQLHDPAYVARASLFHTMPEDAALLDDLRGIAGVRGATLRVHAAGLVGNEQRSSVARIVGIDPTHEPTVTTLDQAVRTGAWLPPTPSPDGPRLALVGEHLARQLGVAVGDELVVFAQAADGSLGNDLLRIHGILRTGNTAIDRGAVYLDLRDAQYLAALEDRAHEVAVATTLPEDAAQVAAAIRTRVQHQPDGAPTVRTWQEITPDLSTMIDTSGASMWVMYLLVYLIVGLGIVNTQRMAAMERRREFGVLLGLGMTPAKLGGSILVETALLATLGGVLGALVGGVAVWYFHLQGLPLTGGDAGDGLSMMGISFGHRLYFPLQIQDILLPVVVIGGVGAVCGIWPAVWAARLDPVLAITGRSK